MGTKYGEDDEQAPPAPSCPRSPNDDLRRRRTGLEIGGEGLEIGARENKIAGKKKTARGARNSFALKKIVCRVYLDKCQV